MSRISQIELDDSNLPPPTPEIEQERKVAMFDLMEENSFTLPARDGREVPPGPYHLGLAIRDKRLVFDITTEWPKDKLLTKTLCQHKKDWC